MRWLSGWWGGAKIVEPRVVSRAGLGLEMRVSVVGSGGGGCVWRGWGGDIWGRDWEGGEEVGTGM